MRFANPAFVVVAVACVGLLSTVPALAGKINPQYSLSDVVNTWQPPDPGPRPPLVSAEYDRYRVTGSGAIRGTATVHLKNGERRGCRPGIAPVVAYPASKFVAWMLESYFIKTSRANRYQQDPVDVAGGPWWLGDNGDAYERGSLVRRGTCAANWGFFISNLPPGDYYVVGKTYSGSQRGSTEVSVGSGITPAGPGLVTIYGPYHPGPARDAFELFGGPYHVTGGTIDVGNLLVAAHYGEES